MRFAPETKVQAIGSVHNMIVKNTTRTLVLCGVTTLVTFLVGVSYGFGLFNTLQAQLTDRFFVTEPVSTDIVIIDIDEESLAAIGQWPWPRSVHGQLLQNTAGARIVGFDVLFTESSGLGAQDDEVFANALRTFEGQVVLPAVIDEQSGRIVYPIETFRSKSLTGFVNTSPDRDGVVRQVSLHKEGVESFDVILAGNHSVTESVLVYYRGPAKSYTTVSYADVYRGSIPKELFANKTILVGASAAGLGDIFQTAFGAMPGVEIHANTIETLRSGHYLTVLPKPAGYALFLLIALLVLGTLQAVRSLWRLTLVLIGIAAGVVVLSYLAFTAGWIIPHLYALILFASLSSILILLQYLFETKEKHFIRSSFEHYVAPEVIAELYTQPDKIGLGGEARELSILFSDIRGFTSISEILSPQQLMTHLNEYLEEMSEAVMQKQGLVDKYIGDAVMAFWGAPLKNERHAILACESVLTMFKKLSALNEKWQAEGRPTFAIGVGVSTGEVVVGNMGSSRRFNYSIIGDEVNFAARIEGLTKQYDVRCIIGETTYEAIKHLPQFITRELDDVTVKGKVKPRRIYELLTEQISDTKKQALEQFVLGREKYKEGDFVKAADYFRAVLGVAPEDGPGAVFLKRTEALLKEPPENWNGVFEFKEK